MSTVRGPGDRASESLASQYGSPLDAYAHDARGLAAAVRTWAAGRFPGVYGPGDMRAVYRWTVAALVALLATGALLVVARLALTGLFVAHVSGNLALVTAFNLSLSALAACWLAGDRVRGRFGRARRAAWRLVPGLGPPRL